jgi:Zn-dependent peptidase ImmA (M78 family)
VSWRLQNENLVKASERKRLKNELTRQGTVALALNDGHLWAQRAAEYRSDAERMSRKLPDDSRPQRAFPLHSLELAEAARKISLSAARGVEAPARLAALERGDEMPSRALLARMSKQYRRPLVVFYLAEPPVTGDRGTDFRTATERDEGQEPLLDAIIRDVRSRQGLVRTALLDEDDVEPLQFVGQYGLDDGVSALRDALREVLTFDRERFRASSTVFDAFDYLRSRAEEAGIFVLLIGDLGSHHTAISPQTFRGYTLADPIAPFVVLNDRDARSAWSFTLLHELCHLLLGTSGVSGAYAALDIERVCDDVASGLLLDDGELGELMPTAGGRAPSAAAIAAFARSRNISRTMVVYRLLRRGSIDRDRWVQLRDRFRAEWLERVPQFWDWLLHRLQRLMSYRSIPSPVRRAT